MQQNTSTTWARLQPQTQEELKARKDAMLRLDVVAWTTAGTIHRCPVCGKAIERELAEFCGYDTCTCGAELTAWMNSSIY